jgi:outer membrane protein OmpA-like peptidoglycan-associated protein
MFLTLKPTIRHFALALPVLLTGLPAALGADQDKLGPVLPSPSLYDVPPTGQPASAAPPPPVSTPASTGAPPAIKAAEPVNATPSAAPQAVAAPEAAKASSSAAPQAAAATAVEPPVPWYRRVVYWLFGKPSTQAKAQPTPSPQPAAAAHADGSPAPAPAPVAHVNASTPAGEPPRHYASDASNRTVRAGMTGECVKMGTWSQDAASPDCQSSLIASAAPAKTAPPPVTPKSVAAGSATMVAVNQQLPKPSPAGSAPAPTNAREYAPRPVEPVEVVPLPPKPPAASEERPLEPEHVQNAEEEPITALAAVTPMVSEPEFDKLSLSAGGLFALSSNKIRPSGQEKLDEMVEHLKGMQYETVLIVGHTDPTGPKAMNDKLSKQRAESVKQYLVSKGVDPKRIKTEGKGGAEPVAKTQNCDSLPRAEKIACYAPDRRVDIEVVGPSPHG